MPRVPSLREQEVRPEALPGARLTVNADPDAFGAGIGRGLQQVGEVANDAYLKERAEVEETMAYELDSQLEKESNRLLFDPTNGALLKQGRNADGLPETVLPEFDKYASELEGKVSSPRVKLIARRLVERKRSALNESLVRHTAKEVQAWKAATFKDSAETAKQTGGLYYNDPNKVAAAMRQGEEAITRMAAAQGLPAEAALGAFRSEMHRQVINSALAKDDFAAARQYYEANREGMTADDSAALGKVIREGQIKVEGREMADRIAATSGSLSGALGQINKITDPEMREEVKRRVKDRLAERETLENERDKSELEAAYRSIESGQNPDDFSATRRLALAKHMPTLRRAWDEKVGGTEPKTNYPRYVELLQEATDNPQTFAKRNLWTDVPSLARADLERLLKVQDEIKQGKNGPERTYINTLGDVVKRKYMEATGEDKPDASKLAGFTEALQAEVSARELTAGKKLQREEVEKIADDLLIKGVIPRDYWFDKALPPAFELTPEDIPAADRAEIIRVLQKRGLPVTDAAIQTMYAKSLEPKK